jgi:large subunit ribosomal protein L15
VVDEEVLRHAGLVKGQVDGIKLLGQGEVTVPLTVRVQAVSSQARTRIEAAGGRVEVI